MRTEVVNCHLSDHVGGVVGLLMCIVDTAKVVVVVRAETREGVKGIPPERCSASGVVAVQVLADQHRPVADVIQCLGDCLVLIAPVVEGRDATSQWRVALEVVAQTRVP